jgi:Fe-Mn family superoxide dismutase
MSHQAKNFDHLIGTVKGLSEKQLRNHFELYKGYVKKLNEIEERMAQTDKNVEGNYSFSDVSELQRRHAVAFNGTYLHQLYFENLCGAKEEPSDDLLHAINEGFGSVKNWQAQALTGLKTANGWVLLCRSRRSGRLSNAVVEEHHRGVLVGQDILLAIDGWEHAFFMDYGIKEDAYFRAILPHLDWNMASQRLAASEDAGLYEDFDQERAGSGRDFSCHA